MFFKLPERPQTARRYKHHEQLLPQIIGDTRARNVASTYIYRAPFKEKMVLTKMLNEWNQSDLESTSETSEVIRPKAATVIKDWLANAKEDEAASAEKFLAYLKEGKGRFDGKRPTKSATFRRVFQQESPRLETLRDTPRGRKCENDIDRIVKKRRPQTSKPLTYGTYYPDKGFGNNTGVFSIVPSQSVIQEYTRHENDIDRISKKRKEWRPQTCKPLTYGSFYPRAGYGNNTGVFNVVPQTPNTQRCTSHLKPAPTKESTTQHSTSPVEGKQKIIYNPPSINRSCLFDNVSLPSERYRQYTEPSFVSNEKQRSIKEPNEQNISDEGLGAFSEEEQSRPSSKLKFSANMHNEENMCAKEKEDLTENVSQEGKRDEDIQVKCEEHSVLDELAEMSKNKNHSDNDSTSCKCDKHEQVTPHNSEYSNYYSVLPLAGYGYHSGPDIGIAGRRRFPGRGYEHHFTLG